MLQARLAQPQSLKSRAFSLFPLPYSPPLPNTGPPGVRPCSLQGQLCCTANPQPPSLPNSSFTPTSPTKASGPPWPLKRLSLGYTPPQWVSPSSLSLHVAMVCVRSVSSPQLEANRSRNSDGLRRGQAPPFTASLTPSQHSAHPGTAIFPKNRPVEAQG